MPTIFNDGLTHTISSIDGLATDLVVETTGTLVILDAAALGQTISHFTSITVGPGASLDISRLSAALGTLTATITLAAGAILVETANEVARLGLNLIAATGAIFSIVACFGAGTMIETERGPVAVERLAIGDRVRTNGGASRAIKWIGRRSYARALVEANHELRQVVVKRDAIADNVPFADLRISPQHAILLDGVLVPVHALVNGRSIYRVTEPTDLAYWHVELDSHDVIIANGLPSESFVDCDNREMFHNAAEFRRLYPNDATPSWAFCAPRVEQGGCVRLLWRRLAARAGVLDEGDSQIVDGHLDLADRYRVSGWAWSPALGQTPVEVEILDDAGVIARVTADKHRPGLAEAGIGGGYHAFDLRLPRPLDPFRAHRIHVRSLDGAELSNSPLHIPAAGTHNLLTAPDFSDSVAAASRRAADVEEIDAMLSVLARESERLRIDRAARFATANRPMAGFARGIARGRRVLVIDDLPPDATRDAGSCAILGHIRALARLGYEIDFIAAQTPSPDNTTGTARGDHAAMEALGVRCHRAPATASVEETLRLFAGQYQLIYLHRYGNAAAYAALARRYNPGARLLYSVADLHHMRIGRQGSIERRPDLIEMAVALRRHELTAMRQCDVVLTHSSFEASYLAREAPDVAVHVVPWPVTASPTDMPFEARRGIAFLGSHGHPPNRDAVAYLADEVMPRVWQRDRSIVCLIAGHGWDDTLAEQDNRIEVIGHTTDLSALFDRVRATIAPLRFGAGLKGKVLDSLAHGVPCVMTPIAAEGIGWPDDAPALVADDAEALAALLFRMHADAIANHDATAEGLALIRASYDMDAVCHALEGALGGVRAVSQRLASPLRVRLVQQPASVE